MNLHDVYATVKRNAAAKTLGGIRIVQLHPEQDVGLFAGVKPVTGANLLLLRCPSNTTINRARLPRCTAFQTRIISYDDALQPSTWIEVEQKKNKHSVQFLQMADNIVSRVETCSNPSNRPTIFLECV